MRAICASAVALALGAHAMPAEKPLTRAENEQAPASRVAGASKTTLGKAIEIALLKVPGEALRAAIDLEDRKTVIEVTVFANGQLFEVEIDGETGAVLNVEEGDEDRDEEDDDGRSGEGAPDAGT